jgi:transcriptional regulator with XRE-family HTH domain
MDIISSAQCRAARALLNWSQPELASKCDMHVQTISSFENDIGSPSKKTLIKLLEVFTLSGITFLPNQGVCISKDTIYVLNAYIDVLNDVERTLTDGDELLLHCSDARRSSKEVNDKSIELSKKGIKTRATICEGNTFIGTPRDVRWIPKDYFANSEVFTIYGDKVAISIEDQQPYRSLIIQNQALAASMRRQFEYWWRNGKPIPKDVVSND